MAELAVQEPRGGEALTAAPSIWSRPSYRIGTMAWALVCLGVVMTMSVEGAASPTADLFPMLLRRALWIVLGGMAFIFGRTVNYQHWRRHSLGLLIVAFGLLLVVLVPGIGSASASAHRWIRLGPLMSFQPSEFVKIALIIWMAAYCERHMFPRAEPGCDLGTLKHGFIRPLAVVGVAAVLALAEPDFGTALLMATLCAGILLVCGTRLRYVLIAGAAVVPVLCLLVIHSPYRLRRITSFLDPWADPLDSGYQLVQSLIAIGSGGLTGKGLGCGSMGFLPAARNDFIFSVIAEQLGLIGALAVIAVFVWIVWEGAKVAWRARDTFGFVLALGLTGMIGLQAVVHIAVDAGAVPTKGLTLPFVSSGGSSLLFSMFAAGILINIALSAEEPDRWPLAAPDADVPEYEHRLRSLAHNTACDVRNRLQRKERSVTWLPTPPAQDDNGE